MAQYNETPRYFYYQKKLVFYGAIFSASFLLFPIFMILDPFELDKYWKFREYLGFIILCYLAYILYSIVLIDSGISILKTSKPSIILYPYKIIDHKGNIFQFSEIEDTFMIENIQFKELLFPFLRNKPLISIHIIKKDGEHSYISGQYFKNPNAIAIHQEISNALKTYKSKYNN